MPVYEYRCKTCNVKSEILWRNFSPPDSIKCKSCDSEDTSRVISRVALHKTYESKLAGLDPRYDKMIDAAADSTREADPFRHLNNMPTFDDATG